MKRSQRILGFACSFALAAVGLMVWSLFDPRPIPVIVAMSVGQVLGTLSLLAFIYVVAADWRAQVTRPKDEPALALKSEPGKV
jgi:hypothetical protein